MTCTHQRTSASAEDDSLQHPETAAITTSPLVNVSLPSFHTVGFTGRRDPATITQSRQYMDSKDFSQLRLNLLQGLKTGQKEVIREPWQSV